MENNKRVITDLKDLKELAGTMDSINKKKSYNDYKKKNFDIIQDLSEKFPQCFNLKEPKPLKICMEYDVLNALKEEGNYTRKEVRSALQWYTGRIQYLEAMVNSDNRYDLEGNEAGYVPEKHKKFAAEKLEEKKKKLEERKAEGGFQQRRGRPFNNRPHNHRRREDGENGEGRERKSYKTSMKPRRPQQKSEDTSTTVVDKESGLTRHQL